MAIAITAEKIKTFVTSAETLIIAKAKYSLANSVNHSKKLIRILFIGAIAAAKDIPIAGTHPKTGKKNDKTHIAITTYVINTLKNGERNVISIPSNARIGVV